MADFLSKVKVDEQLFLRERIGLEDGTELLAQIKLFDKDEKELCCYEEEIYVENKRVELPFKIESIAKDNDVELDEIHHIIAAIDVDSDGKMTKRKELKLKVENEECKHLSSNMISKEIIKEICPHLSGNYIAKILPYLNEYAKLYDINNTCRVSHFLSQVGHESCFKITEENLNFTLDRAKKIWSKERYSKFWINPNYFKQKNNKYLDPQKYANYVYRNRMDNDDEGSGDGYKYRGRGLIQLTGKYNYKRFTYSHNNKPSLIKEDFVKNPNLLSTNLKYGIESAFWYWSENRRLNALADKGEKAVKAITLQINGGYNGLSDRMQKYKKIIKILKGNNDA